MSREKLFLVVSHWSVRGRFPLGDGNDKRAEDDKVEDDPGTSPGQAQ